MKPEDIPLGYCEKEQEYKSLEDISMAITEQDIKEMENNLQDAINNFPTDIQGQTDEENKNKKIVWESIYPSWYPAPEITEQEYIYLKMIEEVYSVKYPSGEWKPIKLTNHQAEFHSNDLAIKKYDATSEVYIKSRATSFTTNAIIRLCNGTYDFRDQHKPIVRITDRKVVELIKDDIKGIIQHMKPIQIPKYDKDGREIIGVYDYWPFNNKTVVFTAHEIYIPDRNVWLTGYPAADETSADLIRGLRINEGLNDENNFEVLFPVIDTAMLNAARGAEISGPNIGKRAFQLTYGTTRKGRYTPFNIWYEKLEQTILLNPGFKKFKIYKWPVFDPMKVDVNKSLYDQPELVTIVPWHTIEYLEEVRLYRFDQFLEEFMAMLTDEKGKLYDMKFISENLMLDSTHKNEKFVDEEGQWYVAVDPAYVSDCFSLSIFNNKWNEQLQKEVMTQTYQYSEIGVSPDVAQDMCDQIYDWYDKRGLVRFVIDGNGPGVPLSQHMFETRPEKTVVIRSKSFKLGNRGDTVPVKEYIHTNQIARQYKKEVLYLPDSVQFAHFAGWQKNYEFERRRKSKYGDEDELLGHGDSTIANGLALLPGNTNLLQQKYIATNLKEEKAEDLRNWIGEYNKLTAKEKIQMYRRGER